MPSDTPTALIVGASRGLGGAIAVELAAGGWQVIGTVRQERTALHDAAARSNGRIEIQRIDMTDADQIAALRETLSDRTIDLLFINAGIATREPFAEIEAVSDEEFDRVMATNALAPMRLIAALQDLVPADGLIGAMSSGQGSIANNLKGRNDAYRASKAALNMLLRGFAARASEAKRAILLLAPGWVKTDLGGDDAPFTVAQTAAPLLADILIAKRKRPGIEYLDRDGRTIPW